MPEKENWFIVLDLSPDTTDEATIEKALRAKKASWSSTSTQSNLEAKRKAQNYLARVDEIRGVLLDPAKRRKEADEARRILTDLKTRQMAILEEAINNYFQAHPENEYSDRLITSIMKGNPSLKLISREDMVALLEAKGYHAVATAKGTAKPAQAKPLLESSHFDQICSLLRELGNETLYEFLQVDRECSINVLQSTAASLAAEIKRLAKTDDISKLRDMACGHAQAMFKDAQTKAKYDNTLERSRLDEFKMIIEMYGEDSIIQPQELKLYLTKTRAKNIHDDEAMAYLTTICDNRGWKIVPSESAMAVPEQCGLCGQFAKDDASARCWHCGKPYIQPCPQCGKEFPTSRHACPACGLNINDAALAERHLKAGELELTAKRFEAAVTEFKRALQIREHWAKAEEALKEAQSQLAERQKEHQAILRLVAQSLFEQSKPRIAAYSLRFDPNDLTEAKKASEAGLERARRSAEEADRLIRQGQHEAGLDQHLCALGSCADYSPSLRAIKGLPPEAPGELTLTRNGKQIGLKWSASKSRGPIRYLLVRKRNTSPTRYDDGELLRTQSELAAQDERPAPGVCWHYAVFAERYGAYSVRGAAAEPIVLAGEIEELDAQAGDGSVNLRYRLSPEALGLEAWRKPGAAPTRPGDGIAVALSDTCLIDTGLENGKPYGYLIVTRYKSPKAGGADILSDGTRLVLTPMSPPPMLRDLTGSCQNGQIQLSWSPVAAPARLRFYKSAKPCSYKPGQLISLAHADALGEALTPSGDSSFVLPLAGCQGRLYFTPLVYIAETGVIGPSLSLSTIRDVSALAVLRHGKDLACTWEWPEGVPSVRLCLGEARPAQGPDDPQARLLNIPRDLYQRAGLALISNAPEGPCHVTAYACGPQEDYSGGVTRAVAGQQEVRFAYEVVCRKAFLQRKVKEVFVELHSDVAVTLPPLGVYFAANTPPLTAAKGTRILHLTRLELAAGQGRIAIEPSLVPQPGYLKLFFDDPQQALVYRLIPNGNKDKLFVG